MTLCYNYCMRNRIRHNHPSLIHCLRAFHILFFAYLLFCCYCYNHYKTQKYYFCYRYLLPPLPLLSYYFSTKYLAANIKFPGVVELTTQLLILENILWLPLCLIPLLGKGLLMVHKFCLLMAHHWCAISITPLELFY